MFELLHEACGDVGDGCNDRAECGEGPDDVGVGVQRCRFGQMGRAVPFGDNDVKGVNGNADGAEYAGGEPCSKSMHGWAA